MTSRQMGRDFWKIFESHVMLNVFLLVFFEEGGCHILHKNVINDAIECTALSFCTGDVIWTKSLSITHQKSEVPPSGLAILAMTWLHHLIRVPGQQQMHQDCFPNFAYSYL